MRCSLLSLLCLVAAPVGAQQPTHACTTVADAAARLACYDKAFPVPVEVIKAANQKAEAEFGWNSPTEKLRNPGQSAEEADPKRIESRVVKVDHMSNGYRRFELENGQAWTLTEAQSSGHVKAGDTVQVRKGLVAGYMLVTPSGVSLRVRRAR